MKTRILLFTIFAVTLFAVGTTITLLFNWQPSSSGVIAAFFASLLISLFGLTFLSFLLGHFWRNRDTIGLPTMLKATRWSIIVSTFLTVALLLRSYHFWNVATGLILVVIFIILDLLSRGRLLWRKV